MCLWGRSKLRWARQFTYQAWIALPTQIHIFCRRIIGEKFVLILKQFLLMTVWWIVGLGLIRLCSQALILLHAPVLHLHTFFVWSNFSAFFFFLETQCNRLLLLIMRFLNLYDYLFRFLFYEKCWCTFRKFWMIALHIWLEFLRTPVWLCQNVFI